MHSMTGRGKDSQSLDSDVLANEKSASTRSAISVPQGCGLIPTEFSVGTAATDDEPGQFRFEDGGQQLTDQQYLSGSSIPSIENQAGGSYRDQGHGSQARPLGVPHAALRDELRGPRSSLLRTSTPRLTDQASQGQSRKARIPNHPNTGGGLKSGSFWRVIRHGQVLAHHTHSGILRLHDLKSCNWGFQPEAQSGTVLQRK